MTTGVVGLVVMGSFLKVWKMKVPSSIPAIKSAWKITSYSLVVHIVWHNTVYFIYILTFAIMKTQCGLSLFIYILSLPPHDNLLLGKIIHFVTWKHHLLCRVFLSHPKSKLIPTLPSRFPYGLFIHEQKEILKILESKLEFNFKVLTNEVPT